MGSFLKLMLSAVIYTMIVWIIDVQPDVVILGICILFAGFIAGSD